MDIISQKRILRSETEEMFRIFSLSGVEKSEKSKRLCLLGENLLPEFGICAFYAAVGFEPDLSLLAEKALHNQLKIVFPRICGSNMHFCRVSDLHQLKPGIFGIPAPETPIYDQNIDMFFVPGLAFDIKGVRLGRGAGYYDRFLKLFPHAFKVGVCFDRAVLQEIPADQHDIDMDAILTEEKIIFCRSRENVSGNAE